MNNLQEFQEKEKENFMKQIDESLTPSEQEYKEAVQKLVINKCEGNDQFNCNFCHNFAYDPLNCLNCEFVVCKQCFTNFKSIKELNLCALCGEPEPRKLVKYNNIRDYLEVKCGYENCFSPDEKILFKDYK